MSIESRLYPFLRAKRLAFLAIWHPRAGNQIIQSRINKDIARLIAEKYITFTSQKGYHQHEHGSKIFIDMGRLLAKDIVFQLGPGLTNKHGMISFYPQIYDRTLLVQDTKNILFKSPVLSLAFDLEEWNDHQDHRGRSFSVRIPQELYAFIQIIRHMEKSAMEDMKHESVREIRDWSSSIKENEFGVYLRIGLTDHGKLLVTNAETKTIETLKTQIDKGYFKNGAKLRFNFQAIGWRAHERAGLKLTARQIELRESSPNNKCLFTIEEDELSSFTRSTGLG